MALREFTDSDGNQWRVWDVAPHAPRILAAPEGHPRDDAAEGVQMGESRQAGHALGAGWLCFENHAEKRRLAPVPGDWHTLADLQLEVLLAGARRVKRREG